MVLNSKRDNLEAIRFRYQRAGKNAKTIILDEFCANCGYNRKYAINTTAGTGSEMTPAAVITNSENHVIMVVWSINASANVAINDPELMLGMPHALTAATKINGNKH